jgi:hypothetical protein
LHYARAGRAVLDSGAALKFGSRGINAKETPKVREGLEVGAYAGEGLGGYGQVSERETAPEVRACVLCALSESNGEARAHRSGASTRGICDTTNCGRQPTKVRVVSAPDEVTRIC